MAVHFPTVRLKLQLNEAAHPTSRGPSSAGLIASRTRTIRRNFLIHKNPRELEFIAVGVGCGQR